MSKRIIVGLHDDRPAAGRDSSQRIDIGSLGTIDLIPQGIVEPGIHWYVAEVPDDTDLDPVVSQLIAQPEIAAAYPDITPSPPE